MYMGNVDFEDLKAIIEYIYKGEVNIAQKSLQKFLKTAVDLQVSEHRFARKVFPVLTCIESRR